MRTQLVAVLIMSVFGVILKLQAGEVSAKRTYVSALRYVPNGPSQEQNDPLYETVNLRFAKDIKTVGQALEFILARSGYHISQENRSEKDCRLLLQLSLPEVHRRLTPMTLRQALSTLIGVAFDFKVNPISRSIRFEVKTQYKPLLSAAVADFYALRNRTNAVAETTRAGPLQPVKLQPVKRRKPPRDNSVRNLDERLAKPLAERVAQLQAAGFSRAQAILAVVETNPSAFVDGNSYRFKPGTPLYLPPDEMVRGYSNAHAEIKLLQHFQLFRQYSARATGRLRTQANPVSNAASLPARKGNLANNTTLPVRVP